jgi:Na+-driven multidrug efflux pump
MFFLALLFNHYLGLLGYAIGFLVGQVITLLLNLFVLYLGKSDINYNWKGEKYEFNWKNEN